MASTEGSYVPPKRPPPPRAASDPSRLAQKMSFTVDVCALEAAKVRLVSVYHLLNHSL